METINTWPDSGWKCVKTLGEGSFGKVYEIEREDIGHIYKAALKVISIPTKKEEINSLKDMGMSDADIDRHYRTCIKNLSNEFALMASMKGNSNIVSYEDHKVIPRNGSYGWDIIIRMELLTPLRDYIKEHPLDKRDVVQLGIDLCKALQICHKKGILHRDIKPANIFINDNDDFKLGDFGVSKTLEVTQQAMTKVGTVSYMAPEVYDEKNYSFPADLYSLALVMYQYLNNGKLPFLQKNVPNVNEVQEAIHKRMIGTRIPEPVQGDSRINAILFKCLEPDPEDRFQTAYELQKALEDYLQNKPGDIKQVICPHCHSLQNEGVRYCGVCGKAMDEPPSQGYCGVCGFPLPVGATTCPRCYDTQKDKDRSKRIKRIVGSVVLLLCLAIGSLFVFSQQNEKKTIEDDRSQDFETIPNKGDVVYFGLYEQDGNKENGKEPIEWIAYEDEEGHIFLVSKYVLEYLPYGNGDWANCSLNQWLNQTFLNEAFDQEEKEKIVVRETYNYSIEIEGMKTVEGEKTRDNVFILRADQIEKYMKDYRAEASPDVKIRANVSQNYIEYATKGMQNGIGPVVDEYGNITKSASPSLGVRPCIYIE